MAQTLPVNTNAPANVAPSDGVKASNDAAQISAIVNAVGATKGKSSAEQIAAINKSIKSTGGISGVSWSAPQSTSTGTSAPTKPEAVYSPAVITSNAAKDNLADITTAHEDIKTGLATQAETNAQKAIQREQEAKAQAEQVTKQNMEQQKINIEKQNADAKKAALTGGTTNGETTSAPTTETNQTTESQQYLDERQQLNDQYKLDRQSQLDSYNKVANETRTTLDQIRSGTFPLSSSQQALVDGTAKAFEQMTYQQELRGLALSSQTGGFSNKVTQTAGVLANIEIQKSTALANLETGFQEKNYKMVMDAYNLFMEQDKKQTDALVEMHTTALEELKTVYDVTLEQKKLELEETKDQRDLTLPKEVGGRIYTYNPKTDSYDMTGVKYTEPKESGGSSPLGILDVQRYNELYPDANVAPGDTEVTANLKVAQASDPENQAKILISQAKEAGDSLETVLGDIKTPGLFKDKKIAEKVAKELYSKTETSTSKIENDIQSIKDYYKNVPQVKNVDEAVQAALKKKGYTNQEIVDSSAGGTMNKVITGIANLLFSR